MPVFTSKELYLMNGGQKQYIGKDGFWEDYCATAAEEAEWSKEIIHNSLLKISTEINIVALKFAIENLAFHKYENLITLLVHSIAGTSAARQLVFASSLWNMNCSEKEFEIVFYILRQHKLPCITDLFQRPGDFKNHSGARCFLIKCLEGNNEYLFEKAQTTLAIWASSGLYMLNENNSLNWLQFNNRNLPESESAIKRFKEILMINK